jgi:hypothetical protein
MSLYAEDDRDEPRFRDAEPREESDEIECACGAPAVTVITEMAPCCRACAEDFYEINPRLRPSVLRANERTEI